MFPPSLPLPFFAELTPGGLPLVPALGQLGAAAGCRPVAADVSFATVMSGLATDEVPVEETAGDLAAAALAAGVAPALPLPCTVPPAPEPQADVTSEWLHPDGAREPMDTARDSDLSPEEGPGGPRAWIGAGAALFVFRETSPVMTPARPPSPRIFSDAIREGRGAENLSSVPAAPPATEPAAVLPSAVTLPASPSARSVAPAMPDLAPSVSAATPSPAVTVLAAPNSTFAEAAVSTGELTVPHGGSVAKPQAAVVVDATDEPIPAGAPKVAFAPEPTPPRDHGTAPRVDAAPEPKHADRTVAADDEATAPEQWTTAPDRSDDLRHEFAAAWSFGEAAPQRATERSSRVPTTPAFTESGGVEKFAERVSAELRSVFPEVSPSDKKILTVAGQQLEDGPRTVGTAVAKSDPAMPYASNLPVVAPAVPAVPAGFEPEIARVPSVEPGTAPTADARALPEVSRAAASVQTVERVLDAAQAAGEARRGSVDLQFEVGRTELHVRIEVGGGEVQATFRTDSPELRHALSREWESVATATAAAERGVRLLPAVFSGADAAPGATPNFAAAFSGGDESAARRESRARRGDDARAGGTGSRGRGASLFPSADPRVAASAPRAALSTSRHLHTQA